MSQRWTRESVIERMRELSTDGIAPTVGQDLPLAKACRRHFGSRRAAALAAGLRVCGPSGGYDMRLRQAGCVVRMQPAEMRRTRRVLAAAVVFALHHGITSGADVLAVAYEMWGDEPDLLRQYAG